MMLKNLRHLGLRLRTELKASPFMRHSFVFFAGSLIVAALNYLYYPVLGRMLTPSDFGEVQTLISLFAQVAILFSILTYVTIHVTVNETDEAERNQTLLGLEHVALIVGGGLLALMLGLSNQLKIFLNFRSVWPFVALVLALALTIPLIIRIAYLRGQKLFIQASLTDGIGSFTKILLSAGLVTLGWRSFGAIAGLMLSQVISLGYGLAWARKAGFRGFGLKQNGFDFNKLRPQFRYSFAVLLVSFSVTTILSLDMLAAKHYLSPDQAGLYAGVSTTARTAYFLTAPFTGVLLTTVSLRQSSNKNKLQLKGSLALISTLGGLALAGMQLFSDFMIRVLVGAKYLPYAGLLSRLGLVMLLLALANTLLMYQIALRRYIYSLGPIAVTFLTLILLTFRHNSASQIVNSILLGSVALLAVTFAQYVFYKN